MWKTCHALGCGERDHGGHVGGGHEQSSNAARSLRCRSGADGPPYHDQFWGRLLAARVYLSGLVDEVDFITCYPGHATTSGPPQVEMALSILAGSVRKKYLPDWIVGHATAQKSQTARTAGRAVDIANQLSTIHLNRRPRKGIGKAPYASPPTLKGKTILVIDDFCTAGNSFEVARAFIEAAGARMIGRLSTQITAPASVPPPWRMRSLQ